MNIHFSQQNRRWDSLLFPINDNQFELTLQFRIRLVRIEPTSHFSDGGSWMNGKGVLHGPYAPFTHPLHAWNDLEWETYKREFKDVIERNWNDKFVLLPNKAWYSPLLGSGKISAPIQCSLKIQLVDTPSQHPHFTLRIIHPDVSFRSYMITEDRVGILTHEDLKFSWNLLKTKIGKQEHRIEYGQITALHEFGHVLGFEHVNGASAALSAYGITLEQKDNLMGAGHHFAEKQAQPWETTIKKHLIPEDKYDRTVKFAGHLSGPQIIAYWDNDFDMKTAPDSPKKKPAKPAKGASSSGVKPSIGQDSTVQGPAGVTWEHMANQPPVE